MKGYGASGIDPDSVAADWEKQIAIPVEVLAKTFGLIRRTRTVVHAASVTYIFERTRDLFGREVCRAFRVTEHPEATPPPHFDPNHPLVFPDGRRDLKPVTEYVNVSCDDPSMRKVVPGSLASPAPQPT
jgi:hypothetical protein